ncbi:MAG: transglycosylase SLT domain-containing protein [Armatimonadetes bacterium]|nr:transglycosylase SLT domain-containing protein [Armatimonadota bacterium]
MRYLAIYLALLTFSTGLAQDATITRDGVKITRGEENALLLKVSATRLAWSPDGAFLAMIDEGRSTVTLHSFETGLDTVISKRASNVRWSPNSKRILADFDGALGWIDISDGSYVPHMIANGVLPGTATWAPDGHQVAYGRADGLYVIGLDGGAAGHCIAKGRHVAGTSWSDDGRIIALADSQSGVMVVRPNGTGLRQIANLLADSVAWSPNGRYLLLGTHDGWQAYEVASGQLSQIQSEPFSEPRWTGGQRLLVAQGGVVRKLHLGNRGRDEEMGSLGGVKFWAPKPLMEISEVTSSSGFKGARRPSPGEMRLNGYIESGDSQEGVYVMRVESMVAANGYESFYSTPVVQHIAWTSTAVQTDGKRQAKLQTDDLRPGDRVSLLVATPSNEKNADLSIHEAWVEGVSFGQDYLLSLKASPHLTNPYVEYDGITTERVVVPLVYPVAGKTSWEDSFLASRGGGSRRHHGQDLMGKHMTPLVACFDGVVRLSSGGRLSGNEISLDGDNGWRATYCHLNDDTPGTRDHAGGDQYAFAPGLVSGMHVTAGQLIGYMGDSGDARGTGYHLHFELRDLVGGAIVNAAPSLKSATKLTAPVAVVASRDSRASYASMSRGGYARSRKISDATMSYWSLITKYAQQASIEPELVAAIIEVESGGNPGDRSSSGAMGLMQLMPDNCAEDGVLNPYDPEDNIRGGVKQFSRYLKQFSGDVQKALIAYNAGPGRVLNGSWVNSKQAREYAPKVFACYRALKGTASQPAAGDLGSVDGTDMHKQDQPIDLGGSGGH